MNMKERIHWINETAKHEFEKAKGMLDMLNECEHTDYAFLGSRVVYSDTASTKNVSAFYADCNDLEVRLWYDELKQRDEAIRQARETIAYREGRLAALESTKDSLAKRSFVRHHKRQIAKARAFLESVGHEDCHMLD